MIAPSEQGRHDGARGAYDSPVLVGARLVGLALLLWGVGSEVAPGLHGTHLGVWIVAGSLVVPWIGWTTAPVGANRRRLVCFVWLGIGGGALATYAPMGLAFVGAGTLGAAIAFELPVACGLSILGPVAAAVPFGVTGRSHTIALSALAVSFAGLIVGVGRRQSIDRATQAALVRVAEERADIERARAAVLAERNRLAREVHDVLAHTLGALAVQLEALDAQASVGDGLPGAFRDGVARTRSLAADGLVEVRRAVSALRDDVEPLDAQLGRLCALRGAVLSISGTPRPLEPEASVALYRVAQESLTNAAKHAPDATPTVRVDYEGPGVVTISVANGASTRTPGPLARTGGGYGLDGIRERVRLLGGDVAAGPHGDGWLVTATVPR